MGARRMSTTIEARDLSAYPDGTSAFAESDLFRGYGHVAPGELGMFKIVRATDVCACGGEIRVVSGERVDKTIREHNETALHQAWRAWRELA